MYVILLRSGSISCIDILQLRKDLTIDLALCVCVHSFGRHRFIKELQGVKLDRKVAAFIGKLGHTVDQALG